jgi:cellulose synthase/poly-beta-1,6-N-acetylglucosamine synthase-like glycosyltransferase
MSEPRVSIVVTAHDAARTIAACLSALAAQRGFAPGELEIVLVDDRSGDGTSDTARALDPASLELIRIDHYPGGPLTARQRALDLGVDRARGAIVLVTDADARPEADWAARLVAPIERGEAEVVAVSDAFAPRHRGAWAALLAALQTADAAFYLAVCALLARLGAASGLLFGAAAFRRDAYETLGGFARIGPALTEDLAFARAAHRAKLRIAFVARPAATVEACASWSDLANRARRTSAGGSSALAIVLGLWISSLIALAISATIGAAPASWLLARWLLGAMVTAASLARIGRARLIAIAPFYEAFAIVTGLRVATSLARSGGVEWGGVRYRRAAPGEGSHVG